MPTLTSASVALLWRGDIEARRNATPVNNRWRLVFAALKEAGIHAEPAVYCEEAASDVRQQLLNADGVLVWVDPLSDGRTRLELDAMLREVASSGVWVSAHPDVTQKMGVKEVLYTTRHLGWGTDTQLYRTYDSFHAEFPRRLHAGGPRVVKQNRGNGGQGVWKVQVMPGGSVSVLEARRGSEPRTVALDAFMSDCAAYFEQGGCIIDQPFQQKSHQRNDPMLYGHRSGGRLRASVHHRAAVVGRTGPSDHASGFGTGVPGAAKQDGNRVDAAVDAGTRHRARRSADHLGRRLSIRSW